ncbi:c-type cytochrome biogenesis protein CcmI [Vibrio sp. 10N.261.46.E12]|uniref:c-type cytochrome biogenesis protein CcmI n=1 Tax=unclassified Vibrio TaxID=2614977 RepID=UPI0009778A5F|nr:MULTISPECIES: c-type cytochrome biogenesis protein CcmI [unclassified Vibrio]OMO36352.1 c-type cytochrome biogenesis protein CcmI [Vibrio sp. 10N.261.45.E1]PMJ35411.1 c-type cytochrome biogenesis protein CcmI [Vibrio sp. 10N.286.45.B6]PML92349.1 c-type cytochrome biogenesis protein CcmI [Vibrio sp. 10N.261.49.E11]PMM74886.1 c-type cytochrome biogenesis protein CcmI [Vibrio sp. 10N.261.46.F12]PMM87667.1 c-type cytochrome biogenesis protein CcmI [Vibrio sp. 10N.261.46.E8]
MTLFWISTIILSLAAILLIVLPFINKKANNDEMLRDELNKAFYKDRLIELEVEAEEGLVDNQQELIADLKQSLLDDVPAQQEMKKTQISTLGVVVPSIILVVVVTYGMYFKFGALDKVQHWQEVSSNLPELSKKLMSSEGGALTDDELEDLTLALRTRLHYQPKDSTGWLLLGRIALANRDAETAKDSMERAYKLEPKNEDVQLGFAQALMLSPDEADQNQARLILSRLIQNDYVDLRVFSLLAFDAFERQDYPGAVKYWSIMQQMIGPQDSRYEMLSRSIESAQQKMGDAMGVDQGKTVAVTLDLSADVNADPNSVLIVSVHRADGSPMPIAAARYPLGTFPRTVVLDDGNSMMEGQKLSSLESLMVRARLDTDGNVSTRDGDWFGESEVVELGAPVTIDINKQY